MRKYIGNFRECFMRYFLGLLFVLYVLSSSCITRTDRKDSSTNSVKSQNAITEGDSLFKTVDYDSTSDRGDNEDAMSINHLREFLKSDNIALDTLWVSEESSDTLIDGLPVRIAYKRSLDESEYIVYEYYSRDEADDGIEKRKVFYGMQGEITIGNNTPIVIRRNDIAQVMGASYTETYSYGLWNFKFKRFENDSLVFRGDIMLPESDMGPEIEIRIKKELHPTVASLIAIHAPLDSEDGDTTIIKHYPLKLSYRN